MKRRDPRKEVGFALFICFGRKHGVVIFFHVKYLILSIDCVQARVNGMLQRKFYNFCKVFTDGNLPSCMTSVSISCNTSFAKK